MEKLINERLREYLTRINLKRAAEVLDTFSTEPDGQKSSYLTFLDHLLEEEVAATASRSTSPRWIL